MSSIVCLMSSNCLRGRSRIGDLQKGTVHEDLDAIFRDKGQNGDDKVTWKEYMTRTFGFSEEGVKM